MPRPQQHRTLLTPPKMKGFKPFGIPTKSLSSVVLLYDEYESIRLLDYEGLTQEQAAERMGVFMRAGLSLYYGGQVAARQMPDK